MVPKFYDKCLYESEGDLTDRRGDLAMEVEIRAMQLQATDAGSYQKLERQEMDSPLEPLEEALLTP